MFRCLDCSWHFVSPVSRNILSFSTCSAFYGTTTFSTIFAFILSALTNALRADDEKEEQERTRYKFKIFIYFSCLSNILKRLKKF